MAMQEGHEQFFDLRDVRTMVSKWVIDCGRKVADKREGFGWDRRQFADLVGTTEATIARIEQGVINPRDYMKLAIAATLQCEVEAIWSYPRRADVFAGAALVA